MASSLVRLGLRSGGLFKSLKECNKLTVCCTILEKDPSLSAIWRIPACSRVIV